MSKATTVRPTIHYETTEHVRDSCLCLAAQRTARVLARHFDDIFRSLGITSGQFSLLMSLNRPDPPSIGSVSNLLAMDRTTLTAALKPLRRDGLLVIKVDRADRRSRRLVLTRAGHRLLATALPLWKREHGRIERQLEDADGLRAGLRVLA